MKLSLLVSSGMNEGELLRVDRVRLLIGRGPQCHVRPKSPEVGLQHCGFFIRGEDAFLRDLDSKTGTFLNGRRLHGEIELRDGDLVQVGPLTLSVILEGDPVPSPPGTFEGACQWPPEVAEKTGTQATDNFSPGWQPATVEKAVESPLEDSEPLIHHAPETQEMPALVASEVEAENEEGSDPSSEIPPEVSPPVAVVPTASPLGESSRKTTQRAEINGRRTQLVGRNGSQAPT
jgi:predicted component of type VI protein secretion system